MEVGAGREGGGGRAGVAGLGVALALLVAVAHARGERGVDFWEHAAVVRELAARPIRPSHPLLALDAPHAFVSPYSLMVGLAARTTGLEASQALGVAAVLDVALLVAALAWFMGVAFQTPRAPTLAVAFAVLLWGWAPWQYSGFVHLDALLLCASYPSTFALGVGLLGLGAGARFWREGGAGQLAATAFGVGLVLLCHPLTAAFVVVGLAALALEARPARPRVAAAGLAVAGAVAAACMWPYWSLPALALREGTAFDESNGQLYVGWRTLTKLGPATLGLLPLLVWARRRPRHPLVVWALILACIWAGGGVTGRYAHGRVLAQLALLLQVACALRVAEGWSSLRATTVRGRRVDLVAAGAAALGLSATVVFAPALARVARGRSAFEADLRAIAGHVGEREVVLADLHAGWRLAALAGRVVASPQPLAFVPDHAARRGDVRRFFEPGCPGPERRRVLARWGARLVLVDARITRDAEALLGSLGPGAAVLARSGSLTLLRVDGG